MEILLHKVCGRPASRTMTLRAAGPEDAAAFYALQNEVRAAMPHPEQFVPDTLENIARYLKEDLCIGGWDGERLGAYFILRYCGQDAHNYAAFMGIPREEWDGWANADSAIVHPDYRKWRLPCSVRASWASGPPSARKISTASTTPWPAALKSSAAGRCTAGMTGICWRRPSPSPSVTLPGLRLPASASLPLASLLAAAPTAPPCFRRWRRSSPLLPKGEALACRSSPCWTSKA